MESQYVTYLEIPKITEEEARKSGLIKTGMGDIRLLPPSVVAKFRGAVLKAVSNVKLEEVLEDEAAVVRRIIG